MKEAYNDLVEAIRLSRIKCPWAKEVKMGIIIEETIKEAQEMKEAFDKNNIENLKEEIGDLIMDATHLALIAEEKNLFQAKEVLEDVKKKLVRRKPWVFGDMKVKDSEEAVKVWNEIKKKEKEGYYD